VQLCSASGRPGVLPATQPLSYYHTANPGGEYKAWIRCDGSVVNGHIGAQPQRCQVRQLRPPKINKKRAPKTAPWPYATFAILPSFPAARYRRIELERSSVSIRMGA
jgi:hypothetical protein